MYIKIIFIYYILVIVGNVFFINYLKYLLFIYIFVVFFFGFVVLIELSVVLLRFKVCKLLISRKILFFEFFKF